MNPPYLFGNNILKHCLNCIRNHLQQIHAPLYHHDIENYNELPIMSRSECYKNICGTLECLLVCFFFLFSSRLYVQSAHLITSLQFASQRPVDASHNPSRSRSFGGGALKRGDEGLPYALRRVFPHPRLFLVLTPVTGLVPLAYLHSACSMRARYIRCSCWGSVPIHFLLFSSF